MPATVLYLALWLTKKQLGSISALIKFYPFLFVYKWKRIFASLFFLSPNLILIFSPQKRTLFWFISIHSNANSYWSLLLSFFLPIFTDLKAREYMQLSSWVYFAVLENLSLSITLNRAKLLSVNVWNTLCVIQM